MSHLRKNKLALLSAAFLFCTPLWALEADKSKPVDIEADHSESSTKDGVTTLTGHVKIDQGTIKARSDKAVIYNGDGGVSRAVLTGNPATLEQMLDDGGQMHAQAQNIDYDSKKGVAVLTGGAVIRQPDGEMRGEHITYEVEGGKVTGNGEGGDGKVHIRMNAKAPDADKKSEKKDTDKKPDAAKPTDGAAAAPAAKQSA